MEVKNIFQTKNDTVEDEEKVPILMNWQGWEGLHKNS